MNIKRKVDRYLQSLFEDNSTCQNFVSHQTVTCQKFPQGCPILMCNIKYVFMYIHEVHYMSWTLLITNDSYDKRDNHTYYIPYLSQKNPKVSVATWSPILNLAQRWRREGPCPCILFDSPYKTTSPDGHLY